MANDYWAKKLLALVDGKIIRVIIDSEPDEFAMTDEPFVGFQVQLPSGEIKNVWLLSDEEGNAPGRFEIKNVTFTRNRAEN